MKFIRVNFHLVCWTLSSEPTGTRAKPVFFLTWMKKILHYWELPVLKNCFLAKMAAVKKEKLLNSFLICLACFCAIRHRRRKIIVVIIKVLFYLLTTCTTRFSWPNSDFLSLSSGKDRNCCMSLKSSKKVNLSYQFQASSIDWIWIEYPPVLLYSEQTDWMDPVIVNYTSLKMWRWRILMMSLNSLITLRC